MEDILESLEYMRGNFVPVAAIETAREIILERGEVPIRVSMTAPVNGVGIIYPYGTVMINDDGAIDCVLVHNLTKEETCALLDQYKRERDDNGD